MTYLPNETNSKKEVSATVTSEKLLDPNIDNWETLKAYPSYWFVQGTQNQTTHFDYIEKSTDAHGGSYAIKLTSDASGTGNIISPWTSTDAVDGDTIQFKCYAKGDEITLMYMYDGDDGYTYVYNFTGASQGTWTQFTGNPSSDNLSTKTLTDTYALQEWDAVTLPSSNVVSGYPVLFLNDASKTVYVDDGEFLVNGVNQAAESGAETWTDIADQTTPLTDWEFVAGSNWFFANGNPDNNAYIDRATDNQSAPYGIKMVIGKSSNYGGNESRGYVISGKEGLTSGDNVSVGVYSKTSHGNAGYFIALNGDKDNYTQVFNFTTGSWEDKGTTNIYDRPGTDTALTLNATTTYTETSGTITVPSSGKVYLVLMSDKGDNTNNQEFYFDTVSMTTQQVIYKTIAENMFSEQITTCTLAILGDVNVDFTTTGATTIYTVPSGYKAIITGHIEETVEVISPVGDSLASIGGNSPDYNDLQSSITSPPTSLMKVNQWNTGNGATVYDEGTEIKVNVTSGDTGSTLTTKVYVVGYLIEK